jgi:hypothetical protein
MHQHHMLHVAHWHLFDFEAARYLKQRCIRLALLDIGKLKDGLAKARIITLLQYRGVEVG